MVKIRCYTLFDCTATGIKGRNRHRGLPMTTAQAQVLTDEQQLALAMNQQRNWDTFLQILSLRTQPEILLEPRLITDPTVIRVGLGRAGSRAWMFEFSTDREDVFLQAGDKLGCLHSDSQGVPMLKNLTESAENLEDHITCSGRANTKYLEIQ